MVQGDSSWHLWRQQGIGSSDAPAIMSLCPYRNREDVMNDKLGLSEPTKSNPAMDLGHKWEPAARAMYFFESGMDLQPAELVCSSYPYLRASLDGYLANFMFLEIKYMGDKNYDGTISRPQEHHWCQMQHQMLVTGAINGVYVPYTLSEDKRRIERIRYDWIARDNDFCDLLFHKLTDFWQEVLIRRELQKNGQHNHPNPVGEIKAIPRPLHSVD